MSVQSGAVNSLRPLLLLALLAACAHGAKPASGAAVFENEQGARIIVAPSSITVAGVNLALIDCSDAEFKCASSEIGFQVSFPRKCPDFTWDPESGPMTMLEMWPHGGGGRYATRNGSHFVYQWQNRYGLTGLAYDPSTDFAADSSSDRANVPTGYVKKSGPRLFACR